MFEVPAPIEKSSETNGATTVTRRGFFAIIRAATATIQSMPPDA